MAYPHYGYSQSSQRGTLYPGQTILVNRHNVQVERYLSKGGFAHVYVVRSPVSIDNNIQHVLKRIAVADQNMLREVQKEVEVMRKLTGHPNIVRFIDASWQALPDGTYEVFILMEFCAGGGMIDMMNRRLRERLTEPEILQIFTDVCEGVAAMHNQNPPLIHRDLKIENILQASPTLYKLCDFGSAIPVPVRHSSSVQELRELEADLGRHTTLQYRAPEMVDVYQRRPIDEKSDIWALGVLLYKLCYYTTPFEEHGPLAILNVQYRIPPYPVYSRDMNALIASMLRELGTQRPTIFELLNTVHQLRGTKSKFHYSSAPKKLSSFNLHPSTPLRNGLEDLITSRPSPGQLTNVTAAAAEGIVPMRRGRPVSSIPTPSAVPSKEENLALKGFNNPWLSSKPVNGPAKIDDAWVIPGPSAKQKREEHDVVGFGDSFSDKINSGPSSVSPQVSQTVPPKSTASSSRDAFDGLSGIPQAQAAPTLGEAAQSSRLGLKVLNKPPPLKGVVSRSPIPQPTQPTPSPVSPRMSASRTGLAAYRSPYLSVEQRYPSLDDLDRDWKSPSSTSQPAITAEVQRELPKRGTSPSNLDLSVTTEADESKAKGVTKELSRTEIVQPPITASYSPSLTNSSPKVNLRPTLNPPDRNDRKDVPIGSSPTKYRPSRPALARKRLSSQFGAEGRLTPQSSTTKDWLTGDDLSPSTDKSMFSKKEIPTYTESNLSRSLSNIPTESPDNVTLPKPISAAPSKPPIADRSRGTSPNSVHTSSRTPAFEPTAADDSSSDEAEGPEEIEVPSSERKYGHHEHRQNSISDLVGLYGGASRPSQAKESKIPTSIISQRQGRPLSGTLIDVSVPSEPIGNLLSPLSILPKSRAELASRHSRSRSNSPGEIKPSRINRPTTELPSTVSNEFKDRRPRSMFLFPNKSKPDAPALLQPPPDKSRPKRAGRRSSISDMVDLYENLVLNSNQKIPPPVAQKPAALKGKTPSPIHSRFPAISPTGNSFLPKLLDPPPARKHIPRRSSTYDNFIEEKLKIPKEEPEMRASSKRRLSVSPVSPSHIIKPEVVSSPAVRPSHTASSATTQIQAPTPTSTREVNDDRGISSPAPERPYQGVSQLISQWQRKSEEAEESRRNNIRDRPTGARFPRRRGTGR